MATNFPNSLDAFTNPTASDTLASVPHASQHADANDAIEALETKVGIDGATSTSTLEVRAPSIVTSSTRPTGVSGRLIYETDTKRHMVYVDGSEQWQPLAPRTGSKNVVMNGDFRVNQRGFSSTTTGATYGFDRWVYYKDTGTATYSSQAFTVGSYPVDGYVATNYARLVTSGQSGATALCVLQHNVEDVRTFNNQTITVSFYARAASGTPKIAVELEQNFGTGGSPSAAVTTYAGQATLSTSWARYSVTVAVPSISGKTLGTSINTSSLKLNLFTSAGTNYNSRTGSLGVQNVTIDIWGVQMERGSTATDLEQRPFADELNMCLRYYEKSYDYGVAAGTNTTAGLIGHAGGSDSGNNVVATLFYTTPKRISVTPTFYTPTGVSGSWLYVRNGVGDTASTVNAIAGFQNCFYYVGVGAAWVVSYIRGHYEVNAEF